MELQSPRSEYDARAASVREHIEKKLKEIEDETSKQSQAFTEQESSDDETNGKFLSVIQNVQMTDVRRSRSCSLAEMKETAITRLTEELDIAQKELKLKDEEVAKLSKIRDGVGSEIEDLTASLFEEANNMVNEANLKRLVAERNAKESNMKLNVLQEEITALKALIQASMTMIEHDKSLSESSRRNSTASKSSESICATNNKQDGESTAITAQVREPYEPDPILHQEFVSWRQNPILDKQHPFLKRIYAEDIEICMAFANQELAKKVLEAIEEEKITIEKISGKAPLPKMCALLQAPRFCHYHMSLEGSNHFSISTLSRNRIAAICDFFCYLRYIRDGLVTQSVHDTYLEVLKKRKAIFLARLGLPESSKI